MILGTLERAALLLVLWSSAGRAAAWRWPDSQAEDSVRIDAKVGFVDEPTNRRNNRDNVQADELFQQPSDTAGFYNRPPGAGRYPARGDDPDIRINGRPAYNDGGHRNEKYQDGTLDSLQYCKCVSTPDCEVRTDYAVSVCYN
ncbi:uncharacterized protein LOC112044147 [Bicyclus anynana]|uniref:Uncharacterized protein LOC112044147 n=1 Tax=Bicyclus anynana TaxID=110368 RepID=A0A6J1MRY0_BICAN|nr:uncharacterized protein LOC112044147 [Bicyclus anynana]